MTFFICSVGTSIMGGRHVPARHKTINDQIDSKLRQDRDTCPTLEAFLIRASAETNGLVRGHATAGDAVALLVSETEEGRACGARLARLLVEEIGCPTQVLEIRGLQVSDGRRFQTEAIDSLFLTLDNLTRDRSADEIRLNATGGFKGTLPYLMLYGMFHGYPVDYVYEFSNTLITLPPLPVAFDWSRLSSAAAAVFAVSAEGYLTEARWRELLPKDYWSRQAEYDLLFLVQDGLVSLSGPGYLLKRQIEEVQTATRILLSRQARKALEDARDQTAAAFVTMLTRVRNPLSRRSIKHAETLHSSDLVIWKVSRTAYPRMAYWVDGNDVFVAELFPTHADYDQFWKRAPKNRADYDGTAFSVLEHDFAVPYAELWKTMQTTATEDEQYIQNIQDELRQARLDLDSTRALINARVTQARQEGRAALQKAEDAARASLKQARRDAAAAQQALGQERKKVRLAEEALSVLRASPAEAEPPSPDENLAGDPVGERALLNRIGDLELHVSQLEAQLDQRRSED